MTIVKWRMHCIVGIKYPKIILSFLTIPSFVFGLGHGIKGLYFHQYDLFQFKLFFTIDGLYFRTISDPPSTMDIFLEDGTKFYQCQYGWWDHSIAMGEDFSNISHF